VFANSLKAGNRAAGKLKSASESVPHQILSTRRRKRARAKVQFKWKCKRKGKTGGKWKGKRRIFCQKLRGKKDQTGWRSVLHANIDTMQIHEVSLFCLHAWRVKTGRERFSHLQQLKLHLTLSQRKRCLKRLVFVFYFSTFFPRGY